MGGAGGTDGETEAGAARLPLSCANSRAQSCTGLQGVGLRECPAFPSVPEYPTSITESGQSPLRALPTGQADAFHRTGLGPAALCGRRYDPPFNREQGSLGKRQRGRPRRTPAFAWRHSPGGRRCRVRVNACAGPAAGSPAGQNPGRQVWAAPGSGVHPPGALSELTPLCPRSHRPLPRQPPPSPP